LPGDGPFVRTDGVQIAAERAALLGGTLDDPISTTESGNTVEGTIDVWTGTNSNGTRSGFTCQGWNSDGAATVGTFGLATASNSEWTVDDLGNCDIPRHIYCFRQPTPIAQW
jgi:hypothetical protein